MTGSKIVHQHHCSASSVNKHSVNVAKRDCALRCADIAEDEDAGQAAKKARGPLEQADPMEADAEETANAAGTALGPAAAAHDSPSSAKAASAAADGVSGPCALLLLFM